MAGRLDDLLPAAEQRRVVDAVARAEKRTSGEIKVHVDHRCAGDAMARARELFVRLGMHRTRHKNGVLVYVAPVDRKYAIVGDEGIHAAAGSGFWDVAATAMREGFARGALGDGLCAAVTAVGDKLAALFPPEPGDANEIPDTISSDDTGDARGGGGDGRTSKTSQKGETPE